MSWFDRVKAPLGKGDKRGVPEGVFVKCDGCGETHYKADFEKLFRVCTKCGKHHTIPARMRIKLICDEGSFTEFDENLRSTDPLNFRDTKKYKDRLKAAEKSSGERESVISGSGKIHGWGVELAVFEFGFMAGSMGSVAGEKITRAVDRARDNGSALIIVSCSGGARMQEGANSLMQMAKTSAALAELSEKGLPFISIITHPTAGGVTASFAMLGDLIIAEPDALICFAGPRVIEQTIGQQLPEGFQRSEFLLEHGFLDMIVARDNMKDMLATLISQMSGNMLAGNIGVLPEQ